MVESFGSDNLSVCGGTYVGGIYSQQIPDEISSCIHDLLLQQTLFHCKNMLEIGSASGATSYIFNYFFSLDHITIIDDNKHRNHIHRKEILKDINCVEFVGDSHSKEASQFVENLDMDYDIIFIDGDHSYSGVKKDMEMYYQFSKYCGYIILHDVVACPGVKQFYNELLHNNDFDIKYFKEYRSTEHHNPLGIAVFKSFNYRPTRKDLL